jgi:hypothetical protein
MMRLLSLLGVSVAWSIAPVVKRRMLDYMSLGSDASPVATFVALYSLLQTALLLCACVGTEYRAFIQAIPAEGWTVLLGGVGAAAASTVVLTDLLQEGNPGLTMVHLNACTSVLSYVFGALFYGTLSWDGTAGVLMIAAGVSLTS